MMRLLFWPRWPLCFLLCVLALAALPLRAQQVQAVPDLSDAPEALTVQWCATAAETDIDGLLAQDCDWRPLDMAKVIHGWDKRAFWLRLSLHNPLPYPVERWLELGHPQMSQISLYVLRPEYWQERHIGTGTPMRDRGIIESTYGVLPIEVGANAKQTAWVRLSSSTMVSLYSALWEPDNFRKEHQWRQFWISLGIGGIALVFVFSLMMLVLTRQKAYGFFALGQVGLFLGVSSTAGVFQRMFWLNTLPMPEEIRHLAGLILLLGNYRFLLAFLPQIHRYPVLLLQMRVAMYASIGLILANYFDLVDSEFLRYVSSVMCGLYAVLIIGRAWRDGDRAAGIILLAFVTLFAMVFNRLLVLANINPYVPTVSIAPFLAIFVYSPLILLGLVDRTRQLQEELTRVRAESAAQLRFLAHMSHELRSPLDIVLGNTQLLAREARNAAQVSGLNSIFDSGRQLLRIIDHILDYARGTAGMLKIEPSAMRLDSFLRGVERMARLLAVQRNNRFELVLTGQAQVVQALTVEADAERLRQVLGNLLANAARHTSDGLMTLTVAASTESADGTVLQLEFTVSDTGEGISEQEQERIFRPFERAESQANYNGKGAGLGLAIARQLVELMGGQLTVRSALGEGAQFVFGVRARRMAQQLESTDERIEGFDAAGYLGPQRAVLVVDDEAVGRSVLCQLLEGLGFVVHQASSGRQAADFLALRSALDLVLTDQFMPDGDGWWVLERVAEFMPQVPVVLISTAPPSPPLNWSGRLRFAAQFLRPLDHAQLLTRMGDLLGLQWTAQAVDLEHRRNEQMASDSLALSAEGMALPDVRHLQELAQLVELGQVTAIEEWVRRLQAEQPECSLFAAQVLEAVHRLDLQGLEAMLADLVKADSARL
jgi:two-component system, sensor histidine kinase LadS